MKNYELIYIVRPTLAEEAREVVLNAVKEAMTSNGAEVESVDVWGNRRLAYEIAKCKDGFYTLVNFKANIEFPKELDRRLRINEEVIRHIIVAKDEK